ncbi:hypothetical protein AAKU67_002234 [Oxalobacteraceae bacterium GrIS 2.11]
MSNPDRVTGLLPLPVRSKLYAAAAMPKEVRSKAIDDAYVWARLHYPDYFRDVSPSDIKLAPPPQFVTTEVPIFLTTKEPK